MRDNNIRNKTISNLVWRFAERCGAQGVAFIVSLVLARLLAPEDYGLIALVTVFTSILQVFVDSGLGNALIQKKDADDLDFSTVFYVNCIFCIILYMGLFISAPFIAEFYGKPELTLVVRALGITLIISGLKNVQQAYVSKNLMFKRFFFATLGGTVGAGILGIILAYCGMGVWALVAQQVFNVTVDTVILWFTVKWRPKRMFSFSRLKSLYGFAWKLLVANLVNTIYLDIRQLIIGKVYSSEDLAYYNRGKQFPTFIVSNINSAIDSVLFPVLSDSQDNAVQLKTMTRRAIKTSSYIMWPLMIGLIAVGESFIKLILTDKWLPCYPYLCIFCLVKGLEPIQTANLNAIKAMGKSDLILKLEIAKKIVGILIILVTMNISVLAMGISVLVYTIYASILNASPNKKLIGYSYIEQLKDMMVSFVLAVIMGMIVYTFNFLQLPILVTLILQVVVGVVIYIGLSILFKVESFQYLLSTIKLFVKK